MGLFGLLIVEPPVGSSLPASSFYCLTTQLFHCADDIYFSLNLAGRSQLLQLGKCIYGLLDHRFVFPAHQPLGALQFSFPESY